MQSEIPSHFTFSDILLSFIFTGIILFICWQIKLKNAHLPYYKFFLYGILAKLSGAVAFCAVYMYYYKDGDALNYFDSSRAIGNLLFKEPGAFSRIVFLGEVSVDTFSKFNNHTGWPENLNDPFSFFFIRLISPLNLLAFWNFTACSILLAALSYSGIWKLYTVFCEQFPSITKELAVAILFLPSVVFWSSGLLKDTITLSALGWFIFSLYKILNRQFLFKHFLYLVISAFLLLSMKPYILYALVVASSVWLSVHFLKKISDPSERFIYAPAFILFFGALTIFITFQIGKDKGRFSIDKLENKMLLSQGDNTAKSTFYKEPVYNTVSSILKSVPANINVTLFRPYIWETKNSLTLFASIESCFLLFFLLWLLIRSDLSLLFKNLLTDPFLVFSLFFILILSFIVGLSTDNFGTLVRFRIPVLPFYMALCFILKDLAQRKKAVASLEN